MSDSDVQCPLSKLYIEEDCVVEFPNIYQILRPYSTKQRVVFWTTLIGLTFFVRVMLYLFRIMFLLACVEYDHSRDSRPGQDEDLLAEADSSIRTRSDSGAWSLYGSFQRRVALRDTVLDSWLPCRLAMSPGEMWERGSRIAMVGVRSVSVAAIAMIWSEAGQKDNKSATRSLLSMYRQLRYESGPTFVAFRGLSAYVFWWQLVLPLLTFLLSMLILFIIAIFNWIIDRVIGDPIFTSGRRNWEIGQLVATTLGAPIAVACLATLLTFQTLRVLSVSPSANSVNLITGIFYEERLFRHEQLEIREYIIHAIFGICYQLTNLIPYVMTWDLKFRDDTYSLWPGRNDRFLLSQPDVSQTLICAYLVWAALWLVLVVPAAWMLFRTHAAAIRPKRETIIRLFNPNTTFTNLSANYLIRLMRTTFQLAVVTVFLLGFAFLVIYWQCHMLLGGENGDVLMDWFVRSYLHFYGTVQCFGIFSSTTFWMWQDW